MCEKYLDCSLSICTSSSCSDPFSQWDPGCTLLGLGSRAGKTEASTATAAMCVPHMICVFRVCSMNVSHLRVAGAKVTCFSLAERFFPLSRHYHLVPDTQSYHLKPLPVSWLSGFEGHFPESSEFSPSIFSLHLTGRESEFRGISHIILKGVLCCHRTTCRAV